MDYLDLDSKYFPRVMIAKINEAVSSIWTTSSAICLLSDSSDPWEVEGEDIDEEEWVMSMDSVSSEFI